MARRRRKVTKRRKKQRKNQRGRGLLSSLVTRVVPYAKAFGGRLYNDRKQLQAHWRKMSPVLKRGLGI